MSSAAVAGSLAEDQQPARRRGGLASDAAALGVAALLLRVASIASTAVLVRLVAKSDYGGYQQLLLVTSTVSTTFLAGIPISIQYFIPRSQTADEQRQWSTDALVTLSALGLGMSILVVLLRHPIAHSLNNGSLSTSLALYAPSIFFSFASAGVVPALVSVRQTGRAVWSSVYSSFAFLVGVLGAAIVNPGLSSLAIGASVGSGVGCVVSLVYLDRGLGVRWQSAGLVQRYRQLWGFGWPLALTGMAGSLGFLMDRLVVGHVFSPGQYAIYAVGAVELPFSVIVQQSVNKVLLPAIAARHAAGDDEGIASLWKEAIRKTSLVLFPLFAFFMIMSGDFIRFLFGARFAESTTIFRFYLLLVPLRIATYGLIPEAVGRTRINLGASVVSLAANTVLAIALVKPFGMVGPAIATPIATAIMIAFYLVQLRWVLKLNLGDLFPWRPLIKKMFVAWIAAIPLFGLTAVMHMGFWRLTIASVIYAPTFLLLGRMSGLVQDDDWRRILSMSRIRRFSTA